MWYSGVSGQFIGQLVGGRKYRVGALGLGSFRGGKYAVATGPLVGGLQGS